MIKYIIGHHVDSCTIWGIHVARVTVKLHTNYIFRGLEAKDSAAQRKQCPKQAKVHVLYTISLLSPREPDGKLKSASKVA